MILILANRDVRDSLSRFVNSLAASNSTPRTGAPDRDPGVINTIISRDMQAQERQNLHTMQRQLDALDRDQPKKTDKPAPAGDKDGDRPLSFKATVFFVRYDAARDKIQLAPVVRTIPRTSTPALTLLKELLHGPSAAEKRSGLATLIPPGTAVRRLHVADGVLQIDLSGHFIRGQKFGREGMILQIYQIVNSMVRFPSVSGIRFLIDGKTAASAGGDWVRMDRVFTAKTDPLQ